MEPAPTPMYRLATVGRPQGLKGEVRLNLHTDDPHGRLAPGSKVHTEPDRGTLTIASLTHRETTWYARFEECTDRTGAESLVHTVLLAEAAVEEDAWYADELSGLRAVRPEGEHIGTVVGLEHYPAHDMLVIEELGGQRTLVPLVEAIVTEIDTERGLAVIDAPAGLLAADEEER